MTKEEKRASEAKSEIIAALPTACTEEAAAVEFVERQRWGDSPSCPHCGSVAVVKLMDDKTHGRNKRFLWYCRDCKKQYTVRVGTVFEDSHVPLRHWCFAFWAACARKKGVSAKQIQRQCQISYKSALFLMHRIRFAMADDRPAKLAGTVEADETYVGGKPRFAGQNRCGRGTRKQPVMAIVERNGEVRTRVVADVSGLTLKTVLREEVDRAARVMTDEWKGYIGLERDFGGGHETVNHSAKEYVRGDVFTNTAESFFAVVKRGLIGTFHAVSRKHLHRYMDEFGFRWNTRKVSDGDRVATAIQNSEGKRLMYREPAVA